MAAPVRAWFRHVGLFDICPGSTGDAASQAVHAVNHPTHEAVRFEKEFYPKADAILLTSFNEWPETTVVEPSSSWKDPYAYLKIVAEWRGIPFTPPPRPRVAHELRGHQE